ncbi:hypothetical protein, partial [Nostoc sp. PCC 9305]|uniref:hypothetical protein n=1 Tax=Nostoc sp. PCC 9305 TaxID=296636 RepID=UPI0039C72C5C
INSALLGHFVWLSLNSSQYVAHVSVSKKLFDVLLPQNVTILEMSNTVFQFFTTHLIFCLS